MNHLNISAQSPKGLDFIHSRFDVDGFLIDPSVWNKTLAKQLAMQSDLHDLSDKHWEVIEIVRVTFAVTMTRRVVAAWVRARLLF